MVIFQRLFVAHMGLLVLVSCGRSDALIVPPSSPTLDAGPSSQPDTGRGLPMSPDAGMLAAEAVGRACGVPKSGAADVLTVSLPTPLVQVQGVAGGNVTSVELRSERTGARHHAQVGANGAFGLPMPPGGYRIFLAHASAAFIGAQAAGSVEIPANRDSFDIVACTGAGCMVSPPLAVAPSFDPARKGRFVGKVTLAAGSTASVIPPNRRVASVRLVPVSQVGGRFHGTLVDADLAFTFDMVSYGKYRIIYESTLGNEREGEPALGPAGYPFGRWTFPGEIEIGKPETTWTGTLPPAVSVDLDVFINHRPMADNGMGSASRGTVVFRDDEDSRFDYLPLGPRSAARFALNVLPGRYPVTLESYLPVGHGLLKAREQDVLPTGAMKLGTLDVAPGSSPMGVSFNVSVRRVLFQVQSSQKVEALDLMGESGAYVWANLSAVPVRPALVYTGCQAVVPGVSAGPTTQGFGGIYDRILGEVCVPCP